MTRTYLGDTRTEGARFLGRRPVPMGETFRAQWASCASEETKVPLREQCKFVLLVLFLAETEHAADSHKKTCGPPVPGVNFR